MKIRNWAFMVCCFMTVLTGHAQLASAGTVLDPDKFKHVQVGYFKTTSIVFPYAIKSLDKGSSDVLMQKAKGAENILLLKAAKQHFTQTNLTVVTADSRLYVFVLNYDDDCPDLNIKADHTAVVNGDILFSADSENQKKIEQYAVLALTKKKKTAGIKRSRFEIKLSVTGIFIHQDILYFKLLMGNSSKINYEIDQLRFFIRDQKKSKRTASQELEITPLYSTLRSSVISDQSEVNVVYALSKFTIPEKKYLTIQLIEKNGGRHIEIDVKNKDLINVDVLNGL